MEINSVAELLQYVETNCGVVEGEFLFRGQPEDKPLLPTIGRGPLGWEIPKLEQRIFREFIRRSPPRLPGPAPESDWHWLAIAQHYGMATRLLDWTSSPLAALWFVVEKEPVVTTKRAEDSGVVWMLHAFDEDIVIDHEFHSPFGGDRTQVFQPPPIARTIVAQEGWFTVHKFITGQKMKFVPLEKNKIYRSRLKKLKVPFGRFKALREQLDRCGVNVASLFPDLNGLCRYLNAKCLNL